MFGELKRVITFAAPKGKQRSGTRLERGRRPGKIEANGVSI